MKKLPLVALAVLFCAAAPAYAEVYLKATTFYSKPSDLKVDNTSAFKASLKSNLGLSGAVGYKLSLLRLEAELQTFSSGNSGGSTALGLAAVSGSVKETTGFANGYFDIPSTLGFVPYLGAGLGYAKIDLGNFSASQGASSVVVFSGRASAFAYQLMAGLQFQVFGTARLHAGYRIVHRQDIALRNIAANAQQNIKLGQNQLFEIGLAFGF
jgi:opacity protein-like surface antigen